MRESEETIQQRLDASLRMQLALKQVPFINEAHQKLMLEWLQHMMFPIADSPGPDGLKVASTPDRNQLAWFVVHKPHLLVPRQEQLMKLGRIPSGESKLLLQMADTFSEATFGTWLQLSAAAQSAGWFFEGGLPLPAVVRFFPKHEDSRRFQEWANAQKLLHVHQLYRATGIDHQSLELILPLSGKDAQEKMMQGLDLFDRLGIAVLPDPALSALLHAEEEDLYLSIRLSEKGAVNIGLLSGTLPQKWLFELYQLNGFENQSDYEALAAFQGTLGVESPVLAKVQQSALGLQIILKYEMLNVGR